MDSSSDSDSEKQEKQPSPAVSNISTPSTATNGQPSQKIRIKTPPPATSVTPITPITSVENNLPCNVDSESKEEKKHKKEKHKKKHKRKLIFEGVFKKSPGDTLSFVAKSAEGDGESIILSPEGGLTRLKYSLVNLIFQKR